jgi:hypothetical protein
MAMMAPAHTWRTPECREKLGLLLDRSVDGRERGFESFIRTVCLFFWIFAAGPFDEDLLASSHTPSKGAIVKSDDGSADEIGALSRTVFALLVVCPNRKTCRNRFRMATPLGQFPGQPSLGTFQRALRR